MPLAPYGTENFDLNAFMASINQAIIGLVCHIFFSAGLHGLAFAFCIFMLGLLLSQRQVKAARPLKAVAKKLTLFCLVICIPGAIALLAQGSLPQAGNLEVSSLGFIAFWSLISLHLSAEEMNFQWF